MELLTQGLLGAAMAQTVAKRDETKRATIIGFLSGLLADADVLIQSSSDPLFMLEYHRHFTHSLFFIPIGALLAAIMLWPFFKGKMQFSRVYVFALLGFSLSGFIDTCTSYGTYLLWPLVNERISFHIISVLDPLFTIGLLLGVWLAMYKRLSRPAYIGLMYCGLYLVFGWWQHERVETLALDLAASRGHPVDSIVVKPTMGNLVLWRSSYISDGRIYADGIRVSLIGENRIYTGNSVALFLPERDLSDIPKESVLYQDVLRFSSLVEGYVALTPSDNSILGDIRYSLLPNSIAPLWAISLNRQDIGKNVQYNFYRNTDTALRQRFVNMLLGRADVNDSYKAALLSM